MAWGHLDFYLVTVFVRVELCQLTLRIEHSLDYSIAWLERILRHDHFTLAWTSQKCKSEAVKHDKVVAWVQSWHHRRPRYSYYSPSVLL